MLSLSTGKILATIDYKGEKADKRAKNKCIYVNTNTEDTERPMLDSKVRDTLIPKSFYNELKISSHKLIILKKHIREQTEPDDESLKILYNKANELLDEILRKEINFDKKEATIFPTVPADSWFGHTAVFGASGSGKSTWISHYLTKIKEVYKGCNIYVFSLVKDDPAYTKSKLNPIYIQIDEDLLDNPLNVKEFAGTPKNPSIIIFDDSDLHHDKKIADALELFRDQVLEVGRHKSISAICVSHVILNQKHTKKVLNECSRVVLFPANNFASIQNYLRRYLGFQRDDINFIKNIGKVSRWCMLCRDYPMLVVWETGVKIF